MKIEHLTGMETGYTMGLRSDGRELLVVCLKGTFIIPEGGEELRLADTQAPLVEADIFTGEPGYSTPLYESDYAPFKPRCDVLLNGSAYAPGGKPASKVPVYLRVGPISKAFNVVGDRKWKAGLLPVKATPPEPFVKMPFSYNCAFGGRDQNHKNPDKHKYYLDNLFGKGYHHYQDAGYVDGQPLPNTEEFGKPVKKPNGKYRPMAFGPVSRSWPPRSKLAGTYDQEWQDNTFPFLPADFDDAYFQAAPEDQQMPYPKPGERVILVNLTPGVERKTFSLPAIDLLAWFFLQNGEEVGKQMRMDTVVIEPDEGRFMVTCRASLPLKKDMFEVEMVVLGENREEREKLLKKDAPGGMDEPESDDEQEVDAEDETEEEQA